MAHYDDAIHNICNDCNLDFPSYEKLRQHWIKARKHHYCRNCDEHFDDQTELEEHHADEHYYCECCGSVRFHHVSLQD